MRAVVVVGREQIAGIDHPEEVTVNLPISFLIREVLPRILLGSIIFLMKVL
jgi:hypothetical protein